MKTHCKTALALAMLLLIPLSLAACTFRHNNKAPNNSPEIKTEKPASVYLPLQVGNRWEYKGTGNEYASYTQYVTFNEGNKYQVMLNNGGTITASRFELTNNGISKTYQEGEVYDNRNILAKPSNTKVVILKNPVKPGTSWSSEDSSYKILQTNALVKVPAGAFENCVVVEVTDKTGESHTFNYYKDGVGLVKTEFVPESGGSVISELEKYSVGN